MKVFLSYSSRDRATAEAFVAALKATRPDLDIFYDQALTLGSFWMSTLSREIERADAFVFLFGERLGPWQTLEYYGAMDRRAKAPELPIAVVLMGAASAPGLPFFDQLQWIKGETPLAPDLVARIVAALETRTPTSDQELWRLVNPYRGLQALREEDAALLYGRDALLADLLFHIADARKPIVAVGNSGVGKSSLFYAGVFASLSRQGWTTKVEKSWPHTLSDSRRWYRSAFKPGEHPLRELARAFVGQWLDPKSALFHDDVEAWTSRLAGARAPMEELIHASDRWAEQQGGRPPPRYVIYVDQAEELYTRADPRAAARVSELLVQAAASGRICVLASLRSDFYGRLQDDRVLFASAEKFDIPRLDQVGLEAVVTGPPKALGASLEEGLADELVRAAFSEPVGLPLLSYQLTEIWRDMISRGDGVLRWPRRRDPVFDLSRALVQNADGYLKLHPEREEAVRRLFCVRLIHVPDQGAPTRRITLQSELEPIEVAIANDLSGGDYRLLGAGETDDGRPSIEIGHEALLTAWERLKNWIADRRSFYAWLTRVEGEAREWAAGGKPDDALLTGRALDRARGYLATFARDIAAPAQAFIVASEANRKRTSARAMTSEIIMGLLIFVVAAGGYGLSAIWEVSAKRNFESKLRTDLDRLIAITDVGANGELEFSEYSRCGIGEQYLMMLGGWYWMIAGDQPSTRRIWRSPSLKYDRLEWVPELDARAGVVIQDITGPRREPLRLVARRVSLPPPIEDATQRSAKLWFTFMVAGSTKDMEADITFAMRWIWLLTASVVTILSIAILAGPTGQRLFKLLFYRRT